ncbi:insulinase family protein [bacterium]|nr:insulinase family protein [bacterium]
MKKIIAVLFLFFLMCTAVDALDIQRFELDNGLKVIVYEDHKIPEIVMHVAYRVGSMDEEQSQSGIAHVCEHMMFNGTQTLEKTEIDMMIKQAGGHGNAYTAEDITNYYFILPSYNIETGLMIESDRMANAAMDPDVFLNEMKVVKEEKNMRYGNSPWGRFWMYFRENYYECFPKRHPVIGYDEDLDAMKVEAVKAFYNTYYKPNNATLVLAGNITLEKAREYAEKYFGSIKPSHIDARPEVKTIELKRGLREFTFEDPMFSTCYLMMAIPIPGYGTKDYEALTLVAGILGGGNSSWFQENLVNTGISVSAWASTRVGRYGEYIMLGGGFRDMDKLEEGKKIILDKISKMAAGEIDKKDYKKILNNIEAADIFSRQSLKDIASNLSVYETHYKAEYVNEYLENIRKLKLKDLKAVASKYFKTENMDVYCLTPELQEKEISAAPMEGPKPANYKPEKIEPVSADPEYIRASFEYLKKTKTKTLENGMQVIALRDDTIPAIHLKFSIKAGPAFSSKKNGLAQMALYSLGEGTQKYSLEEINRIRDYYAIGLDLDTGYETLNIRAKFLTKFKKKGMGLISQILMHPTFPEKELNKLKNQMYAGIAYRMKEPDTIAQWEFLKAFYGEDHPYAIFEAGDIEVLTALKRQDIVDFYNDQIHPENIQVTIMGNMEEEKLIKLIEKYFKKWNKNGTVNVPGNFTRPEIKQKEFIKEMENITQAVVSLAYPGADYSNEDKYYLKILTSALGGGSLTSLLGIEIRLKHGLAYYVFSYDTAKASGGFIKVQSGIAPANIDKFRKLAAEVIQDVVDNGLSEEILRNSKNYLLGSLITGLDSTEMMVGFIDHLFYQGVGIEGLFKNIECVADADNEKIKQIAAKYFKDPIFIGVIPATGK